VGVDDDDEAGSGTAQAWPHKKITTGLIQRSTNDKLTRVTCAAWRQSGGCCTVPKVIKVIKVIKLSQEFFEKKSNFLNNF
jgi:hypothetical protein